MLVLIAFRGVLKMRLRRARFLGMDTWLGAGPRAGTWVREAFLYGGFFFVIYAFDNMYTGASRSPGCPAADTARGGQAWPGWPPPSCCWCQRAAG
jgi:hypothetical protein